MKRFKLISAIILIFLLGILVGTFGNAIYQRQKMRKAFQRGPGAMLTERLISQLDLTHDQQRSIEKVSAEMNIKMENFFSLHRIEGERIIQEGFNRMKEYLDPEQQQKLNELFNKLKNRHPFPRPPHPPGIPSSPGEPPPPYL